jgi:hypothetical protein
MTTLTNNMVLENGLVLGLNANREPTLAGKAWNIALFLAAPFIGLAYLLAFPVVGLGMIAWLAGKAIMKNEKARPVALLIAAPFITLVFVAVGPIVGLGALARIGCKALLKV